MTSEMQEQPNSNVEPEPALPEAPEAPEARPVAPGYLFPLIIVVLAVFPATLGISFTRQSPAKPAAPVEDPPDAKPNDIQLYPNYHHLTAPDRSHGDELVRDGRYEAALHLYRSFGSADSLRVTPELGLRMGLCQEGLGLWDESLATYRSVANSSVPGLAPAAVLGQARIWMRLNDFASAEPLLRSLLLQSGQQRGLGTEGQAEVAMLYPIVLTELALADSETPKSELTPVSNPLEWLLGNSLKWLDAKPRPADRTSTVDLLVTKHASSDDINVLAMPLVVSAQKQTVEQILSGLSTECALNLEWSEVTKQRAADRVLTLTTRELPLCLLLSAVCHEIDTEWQFDPMAKTIHVIDRTEGHQRANSAVALRAMIAQFPEHRLSGSAKFALAQLAAADARYSEAAELYSSMTGGAATSLAVRAALNAALAYRSQGDLVRTCQMLQIAVHGGPGNEFHTRALILHGRALMDRGDFKEAAFQLKRAAGSRHKSDEQARAAVLQGMAELLDGRPQAAAETLFVHRLQFQDRTVRNGAALMTSIARWRTLNSAEKNREAAFLYRSIVAVEEDPAWLGPPGKYLLGQAMHDADLDDRMVELYTRSLEQGVPQIVERLMKLALADYWYSHGRQPDAKAVWLDLHSAGGPNAPKATWRLANVAMDERQPDQCLDYCRALRDDDSVPQAELLKLAGRAYETSGRPVLAAQCYAGQWP